MDVWIDRRKLDGLLSGAVKRTSEGRLLTTLTHDDLYARMPEGLRAKLLGTISGGDHDVVASIWGIPGIGRRQLYVRRSKLAEVVRSAEPWSPPAPPDVQARRCAALAHLRALRPQPPGEADQLSLLG